MYRGVKDGRQARDVVTVAHATKTIDGVPCAVVQDRLYLGGRLEERTTDWYTQDRQGNVWYFGESTAELDRHGRVTSTEGSWRAGRDGTPCDDSEPWTVWAGVKCGARGSDEIDRGRKRERRPTGGPTQPCAANCVHRPAGPVRSCPA